MRAPAPMIPVRLRFHQRRGSPCWNSRPCVPTKRRTEEVILAQTDLPVPRNPSILLNNVGGISSSFTSPLPLPISAPRKADDETKEYNNEST